MPAKRRHCIYTDRWLQWLGRPAFFELDGMNICTKTVIERQSLIVNSD